MGTDALRRRVLATIPDIGAAGTVFNPTYANIALWLMADVGITLVSGQVDSWKDQSAAGVTFVSDGAHRLDFNPTDTDAGGRPCLAGSSTGGYLTGPSYSSLTGGGEIFTVIKSASSGSVLWRFGSNTAGDIYNISGDIYTAFASATSRPAAGYAGAYGALTNMHVYSVVSVAGEYTEYIDGNQIYTRASNTVGWDTILSVVMGYGGGTSGTALGGASAGTKSPCVIMYNTKLSSTDRATVVARLRERYAF